MGVNALCQIEKPATAAPFVRSSTVPFQAGSLKLWNVLDSAVSGSISSCGCHAGWRCSKSNLSTVHWRISLTGTAIEKEHDGGVRGEAKRPHPPEELYVPVTRKVSPDSRIFCTLQKHPETRFCLRFQRYAYFLFAIAHDFNGFEAFLGEFR